MLPRLRTPNFFSPSKSPQPWSCPAKTTPKERICCQISLQRGRNRSLFRQVSPLSGDFGAYSRRAKSISESLRRFQLKRDETAVDIKTKQRKKTLCRLLRRHMGVKLASWDLYRLSEEELALKAAHVRAWKLAKGAARTMIKWLHRVRLYNRRQRDQTRIHMAAFRIQKQWKRHWVRHNQRESVAPRQEQNKRQRAAVTIQRWMRGHLAREKCKKLQLMRQVNSMHFHYQRVRYQAMVSKAPTIWKSWQNYRKRKQTLELNAKKGTKARIFIGLVNDVVRSTKRKGTTSQKPEMLSLSPIDYKKTTSEPPGKVSPRDSIGGKVPIARQRSRTDPVERPKGLADSATAPVKRLGRK